MHILKCINILYFMSATVQTDWQRGAVQPSWSAVVTSTTQCPFLTSSTWMLL